MFSHKENTMEVYAVTIVPTIFSVQNEISYQVKVGIPLPPPSTLIGAVVRGIGLIKKLIPTTIDDTAERGKFMPSFLKLRKTIEDASRLATVKPLSSIACSSVLHRIVRFERRRYEEWSDALVHQIHFTHEFSVYLMIDLDSINEKLGLDLKTKDILEALYTFERLGNTEHHVAPKEVRVLKAKPINTNQVEVTTYVPAVLVKPLDSYTMLFMKSKSYEEPQPYLLPLIQEANIYKPINMKVVLEKNAMALDIEGEAITVIEKEALT